MFNLPFWAWAIIASLGLPLMIEVGFRLYGPLHRLPLTADVAMRPEHAGAFASYAAGLLSLLLAFTLSSATGRNETRRAMIAEEADQISTAYQSVQLIDEPGRSRLSALVEHYARYRQAMIQTSADAAKHGRASAVVEADQSRLMTAVTDTLRQQGSDVTKMQLFESASAMLSSALLTNSAIEAKTAPIIRVILGVIALWTALLMGYHLGAVKRRYLGPSTVVALMFAWTILVVDAVDHPGWGVIQIGTGPLQRTVERIDRSEATKAPQPAQN